MSIRSIKYDEVSLMWAHFYSTVSLLIDRCMGYCMKALDFVTMTVFLCLFLAKFISCIIDDGCLHS